MIAEYGLNAFGMLLYSFRALCSTKGLQQLGCVASALGCLACPMQHRVVAVAHPRREPPFPFSPGPLGLAKPLGLRRPGIYRRVGAPVTQRRHDGQVSRRVHGIAYQSPRRKFDALQFVADAGPHRTQDEFLRELIERRSESAMLHLAVADIAEQGSEPAQFPVEITDD